MTTDNKAMMWAKGIDLLAKIIVAFTAIIMGWVVAMLTDLVEQVNRNKTEIAVINSNRWSSIDQANFYKLITEEHQKLWNQITTISAKVPSEYPPAPYRTEIAQQLKDLDTRLRHIEKTK